MKIMKIIWKWYEIMKWHNEWYENNNNNNNE